MIPTTTALEIRSERPGNLIAAANSPLRYAPTHSLVVTCWYRRRTTCSIEARRTP